jgi:hypothetical protein
MNELSFYFVGGFGDPHECLIMTKKLLFIHQPSSNTYIYPNTFLFIFIIVYTKKKINKVTCFPCEDKHLYSSSIEAIPEVSMFAKSITR